MICDYNVQFCDLQNWRWCSNIDFVINLLTGGKFMSSWASIGENAAKQVAQAFVDHSVGQINSWLDHHPHDHVITIEGVECLVREHVRDWFGHQIELEILSSEPISGIILHGEFSGVCSAHHAKDARREALENLAFKVRQTLR
jgi:hypothetical protein